MINAINSDVAIVMEKSGLMAVEAESLCQAYLPSVHAPVEAQRLAADAAARAAQIEEEIAVEAYLDGDGMRARRHDRRALALRTIERMARREVHLHEGNLLELDI